MGTTFRRIRINEIHESLAYTNFNDFTNVSLHVFPRARFREGDVQSELPPPRNSFDNSTFKICSQEMKPYLCRYIYNVYISIALCRHFCLDMTKIHS